MATITDNIKAIDGTPAGGVEITFELYQNASATDTHITARSRVIVETDATDGSFSVDLLAGLVRIRWKVGTEFNELFAQIPDDSDTYTIADVVVDLETLNQINALRAEPIKVLGRSTDQSGPLEFIGGVSLLDLIGEETRWSLLSDEDDQTILDVDGVGIGDENQAIESPIRQTRFFLDVAEMLASTSGSWDRAVTLNWTGTDGDRQEWVMMQDPTLTANGGDLLEMDDGFGFAHTFTTRGPAAGDNFATIDSVTSAIAGTRYTHTQSVAANSWNIVHGMGLFPSVTTTNSSGKEIKGEVVWLSDTTIAVSFSRPLTGFAYLN